MPNAAWGIPYNEVRAILRDCGLNTALDGWSNVLDCTTLGVASLAWTGGIDRTPVEVASDLGLLIEDDASPERVAEVVEWILTDGETRAVYIRAMQDRFADHVEAVTLRYFRQIVERITA